MPNSNAAEIVNRHIAGFRYVELVHEPCKTVYSDGREFT